jgi:hypothetical protein
LRIYEQPIRIPPSSERSKIHDEEKIRIFRAADGGKRIVEICKDKNISEGLSRPAAEGCTDR